MEKLDTTIGTLRKYSLVETDAPKEVFLSTSLLINRKHFDVFQHQNPDETEWLIFYQDENRVLATHQTHGYTAKWIADQSN